MRRRIAVTLLVLMLAGGAMGWSRGAAEQAKDLAAGRDAALERAIAVIKEGRP